MTQPPLKTITVRYFASIRETLGHSSETLHTQADTLGALREELLARGNGYAHSLAHGTAIRMALNQDMCRDDALLPDGAEVAFFPPVTGG